MQYGLTWSSDALNRWPCTLLFHDRPYLSVQLNKQVLQDSVSKSRLCNWKRWDKAKIRPGFLYTLLSCVPWEPALVCTPLLNLWSVTENNPLRLTPHRPPSSWFPHPIPPHPSPLPPPPYPIFNHSEDQIKRIPVVQFLLYHLHMHSTKQSPHEGYFT